MVPGAEELGAKDQGREEPENKTTCALAASEGGELEKRERGRESTLSLGLLPLFVHKTEPGHEAKRRKERKEEGRRGGGSGEESIKCGRLALPKHTSHFCAPDGECHSEGSD